MEILASGSSREPLRMRSIDEKDSTTPRGGLRVVGGLQSTMRQHCQRRPLGSFLFLTLLLSGCLSFGNSTLRDDTAVARIKVGLTTKEEVRAILGPPSEHRSTPLGSHVYEWWSYTYSMSVINPLEYLLLVGLFINGIGLPDTRRDFQVFFDPDGKVRTVTDQVSSYDLGVVREHRVASTVRTHMMVLAPLLDGKGGRFEDHVGSTR
jgi:outer membrane protein assembly factor BamE (lipoprotein component of BamABCDE complex)